MNKRPLTLSARPTADRRLSTRKAVISLARLRECQFKRAERKFPNDLSAHLRTLWGTTPQKLSEDQSLRPQSRPDCNPRVSPKTFLDPGLSHSGCEKSGEASCSPEVSFNGLPCGLWRRGAVCQYRTRVPADLIASFGKPRKNRSLKTTSLATARRSVRPTAYEIERQFEILRQVGGVAADQEWIVVAKSSITSSPVYRTSPPSCSLTFAEVCERYLTDPTISRTAWS
ncbi:DUF6538 domain-containing protein [Sphingomonas citricola]|uniref:DUF6538 domain-containing protein n=1 Tax=Sphingomonas citricola TaxID=2862498 RepID=UPI00358DD314